MIPLFVPEIRGNEWAYVKECLDTGWVSSVGAFVDRFEAALAAYAGATYAVACVNGTSALHMALMVAGVKADEEVLVPALSFIAPANAIRYVGAWPVFMDIAADTLQMDPQKIQDFLTNGCDFKDGVLINRTTKRIVRAILPVHLLGHPADMDPILDIAQRFNLIVIEDAAESLGATYKGKKTGGLAHIGCFSFNGNKIITTGGGGMVMTNHEPWAKRVKYLSTQAKDSPSEYLHHEVGYNYRLTNIQAALGVAQMELLPDYVAKKRHIAAYYEQHLKGIEGITLPREANWAQSNFWLYTIAFDEGAYGAGRDRMIAKFKEHHIQTRPLWNPLHELKPFKDCQAYHIDIVPRFYAQAVSLPSSVGLTQEQQDRVIGVIRQARG